MVAPGEQSLRKQPRRQGQHASLDVEAVGITRPAIIASFDRQTVIPASCQSAAAGIAKGPPLCGTVGLDVGDHNVLPSQRNKSEQPHSHAEPAGDPPPRKNGRIDGSTATRGLSRKAMTWGSNMRSATSLPEALRSDARSIRMSQLHSQRGSGRLRQAFRRSSSGRSGVAPTFHQTVDGARISTNR